MPVFASTELAQFKRDLRSVIDSLIARGNEFTVDDIWGLLMLRGYEDRAPDSATIGAILNSYAASGLIENTNRSHISQRGVAKGRRVSIWRVIGGA